MESDIAEALRGASPRNPVAELDSKDLFDRVLEVYDQADVAEVLSAAEPGSWCRETVNRWARRRLAPKVTKTAHDALVGMLPAPPAASVRPEFTFIDLFAGIGGLRRGFERAGGECVFTSEWDRYATRTYKANHYCDPERHRFNQDIRDITWTTRDVDEETAYARIDRHIPDHDVLVAGFPCQPFSLAGVSKKNALGRKHGFECNVQGTLFFDVARILAAKRPAAFMLENVKNLKSHDRGRTFRVICEALDELGYEVADVNAPKGEDPKVIDARHFLPQHRERLVLVGFRRDLGLHHGFTLNAIRQVFPETVPAFGDLLDEEVEDRYILTPKLWKYLYDYAARHRARGNGFGFGLTRHNDVARTLSARYHKDGSEILVDRGLDETRPIDDPVNMEHRPRRLTPRECARLMGFDGPGESRFTIPVSDTQAYRQFGNSVAVPVFEAVAVLMRDRMRQAQLAGDPASTEEPYQEPLPLAMA